MTVPLGCSAPREGHGDYPSAEKARELPLWHLCPARVDGQDCVEVGVEGEDQRRGYLIAGESSHPTYAVTSATTMTIEVQE